VLLPTTHQTAILLLIASLICLGSWPNFLKLAKWRFELFYFDFAAGALVLAIVAAMTLGTLGSELSFNDRIAVAGLRSQAMAIGGGFVFSIGNMLLVAAISLVGMAASVPLALSLVLIVVAVTNWQDANLTMLMLGTAALLTSVITAAIAMRKLDLTQVKKGRNGKQNTRTSGRGKKGIVLAVLGGLIIGGSALLAEGGLWGDLGLGAYAGSLMFCVGLAISTAIFNLFFMNIGIEGGRVTFGTYLAGKPIRHLLGFAGGVLWAVGSLAVLLAQSVTTALAPDQTTLTLFTQGAALVALVWGILAWREFAGSSKGAKISIALTAAFFIGGCILLAYRFQP